MRVKKRQTQRIQLRVHRYKISVIGLDDIVVVDTPDALLVAPREQAQAVKDTVAELKDRGLADLL